MSSYSSYPFAIRLIGFPPAEVTLIEANFAKKRDQGYRYFNLLDDNLQDPDIFLANAEEQKALVALSYLTPSDARPVLLVGPLGMELPHARVPRPIEWNKLLLALDKLVEKRADALCRLEASDIVTVPERRRRDRFDMRAANVTDYSHMRRSLIHGGVLIIDKNSAFRDYVAKLLVHRNIPAHWTNDETEASNLCRQGQISLVIVNTSTPEVDPYRLCHRIKNEADERVTVIFIVGKSFIYDQAQARRVNCNGFLNKPLHSNHLVSVLKKFLPQIS